MRVVEGPPHVIIDQRPSLQREVARRRILLELELGPDEEMHDLVVDAVRPVVDQYLDVV